MNKCASCIHSDFNPQWIKWCEVIKDYIHIATPDRPCTAYQCAWDKNLFGKSYFAELIEASLIIDATAFSDAKDLRPCMVKHRNISSKKMTELLKQCKIQ